ncbi:hypothetical protein ALI22I_01305 [Saccharothrix sp. ALI-22-I]|uniref:HAF repeat-containing protein n=1 Tax=Saccharothrix sp. ALI-22-I TaxID=1933778 RepID=UPI00097C0E72|nr:HAF repeat-containing protein [Saccharothrix sp. ALI-22-I]ONI92899.1 hypothetical protein ALI22I_01305 [Saccharothrix sp. ALI-22-I]
MAQAQVVPKYVYVDLGPVGLTSTALDVNNAMQAVVTSGTAFRWENGTLLNLGTLCSGCNPRRSYGTAVNDTGEVAGYTHVQTTEPPHAFVYRGGAMIDLGTGFGSGSSSAAWGINSGGQVVGERTRSQSSPKRAALWQNGTIRDLGTLGGTTTQRYATESIAYAINDSGQVVGTALPSKGYPLHGFVWQNGVMRDLGTLGGDGEATEARDIADTGQIVGSSQNTGGEIHAFTWTAGTMTDLGTLGGDYSSAYGVNEHGRIVGGSRIADSPDPNNAGHAVLWTDGLMVDLNEHVTNLPEDVALEVAWSINDDGAIVGTTCSLYCEPGKTATPRGFLLVPQSATA